MTTDYGVSIRDAAMMIGVPEQTIRSWLRRVHGLRSQDGQVDPFRLQEWFDYERDHARAKRQPAHRAKHNPYQHPESPASQAAS
jgi:hypothetical protein